MHATRPLLLDTDFPALRRTRLETLQVNLGYTCNQRCLHCHVNAGPNRREQMSPANIRQVLAFLRRYRIPRLDLTGGAPELNSQFRYLVTEARQLGVQVIDRCNLTILNQEGQEDLASFLAANQVEIVASLPCYLEENVDGQRGKGVYNSSIRALQTLNQLGYGQPDSQLRLNLMYNPTGASLPPSQQGLEQDYKHQLRQRFGIVFNHLYTLTNMPIMRFGSTLISHGEFDRYMQTLRQAHQTGNLDSVMCRSLVSIDWQGYVYDCDFNQMLDMPLVKAKGSRRHISQLDPEQLVNQPIQVGDHCYGCTAGGGSSCGGALS